MADVLEWLQYWYGRQCDGDWEHSYGIRIDTLDNPGWRVAIDLAEAELEARPFVDRRRRASETDWIECSVQDNVFKGYGGPQNLGEILEVFRSWAEPPP